MASSPRLANGIGKYPRAHGRAIERAIPIEDTGAETFGDGGQGRTARRRQGMGDGIGIDHVGPQFRQPGGHRAFPDPTPPVRPTRNRRSHQPSQS
jgi:hypothetical protein